MKVEKLVWLIWLMLMPFALFAQTDKGGSEKYVLEPGKPEHIPVILNGPNFKCQPVKLLLEATYQQKNDNILITIQSQFTQPLYRRYRYTHLWCPIFRDGEYVYYMALDKYFRRELDYWVERGIQFSSQIRKEGRESYKFENAFQCTNGEISMEWDKDVMYSLKGDRLLTIKIAVKNLNEPVSLTLHNLVPLKEKTILPQLRSIASLKYVADDVTVSFEIPTSDCFGTQEQIQRYRKLNEELQKDYQDLVAYMKSKSTASGKCKECDARRMMVLEKYASAKLDIKETQCKELANEYEDFNKFYGWLGEGIVTPDSICKMILEMDELIDDMAQAQNKGDVKTYSKLKARAKKYITVKVDADMFKEVPEMKSVVKNFMERRGLLEELCGGTGPDNEYRTPCRIDTDKIKKATSKINKLLNDYLVRKVRNDKEFALIEKDIDAYLATFSEGCKKKEKYSSAIEQYLGAKKAYKDAVK